MTAPRAREQRRPPSSPDRRPPRRGGGSSPSTFAASAAGRPAGPARLAAAPRGLLHSARALAAAVLLALTGALALPAAAQAVVLVSNIGQSGSGGVNMEDDYALGQAFSVGADGGDYTLTSIEIPISSYPIAATDIGSLSVSVWTATSSGHPSSLLHTLMNPESIAADTTVMFDAQAGATLEAGQTYVVVVYYNKNLSQAPSWLVTGMGQDSDPATGWTIADSHLFRASSGTTWSAFTDAGAFRIRVNGTAVSDTPTPTNFTVAVGNAQVTLSWDTPPTGVTGHEFRYKTGTEAYPASFMSIANSGVGGTNAASFTVGSLTNEVVHTFQLRAVNDAGNSTAVESDAVTPTPGICDRTQKVHEAIVYYLEEAGVTRSCAEVNVADLAGLAYMEAAGQGITSLKAGDFAGLTSLRRFELGGNSFTTLPAGVFSDLTNLHQLDLSDGALSSLPAGVFSGQTALVNLLLDNNALTSQSVTEVAGLTSLQTLWLHENDLEELPDGLFSRLTSLTDLKLSGNDLEELPDGAFSGLTSLGALTLGDNPDTGNTLTFTVRVEKVGADQVRAKVLAGAPFEVDFTPTLANGSLPASDTKLAVPKGSVDGTAVTVTRTSGTMAAVTVDIDLSSQPSLPATHSGYTFAKAAGSEPVEILPDTRGPQNLTAAPGDGQAVLAWDAPPSGSGVTKHQYHFKTTGGSYPTSWTDIPNSAVGEANEDGYTVPNLTNETAYTFELRWLVGASGSVTAESNTVTPTPGICDRTQQVREAIIYYVESELGLERTCAEVTVADLAGLTFLEAGRVSIGSLKSGDFEGLTSVTTLELNGNTFTTLPANLFSDMTSLVTLNLNSGALSSIDARAFSGLTSLQQLKLDRNELGSLPNGVFSGLTALQGLSVDNNDLTALPAGVFSGLTSLQQLELKQNNLSSLLANVFSRLSALRVLGLQDNDLTSLPAGVFDGLTALKNLALNGNDLDSLPAGAFTGLSVLNSLLLQDNDLTSLPAGTFTGLTALAKLNLGDNPNTGDVLRLTVTVEKVGTDQVRAKVLAGAPFAVDFTPTVANGSLPASDTMLAVPAGSVEGRPVTVTRTSGTTEAVTVDIDLTTQPTLPDISVSQVHEGYEFARSSDLPVEILPEEATIDPPTDFNAAPGADQEAVLSWTPPAANSGYTRHEYRYQAGNGSFTVWTAIPDSGPGGTNASGYTVTGLGGLVEHLFELRAASDDGRSRALTARTTPTGGAVVTLHLSDVEVLEDATPVTVTATASPAAPVAFTVEISASPVAPATDDEFELSTNRTLRFAAGATGSTGTVTIRPVDDDDPEPPDVVTISGVVSNPAIPDPDDVTLTIHNNDKEFFEVVIDAPAAVNEGAGTAAVTYTLTKRDGAPVAHTDVIFYHRDAETATRGVDYTPPPPVGDLSGGGLVVLETGLPPSVFSNTAGTVWVAERTFTIGIVDDEESESDETIVFTVEASKGESPEQTIVIRDDDRPPAVSIAAANPTGLEGQPAVFTLSRTGATGSALTVTVALTEQADRDVLPDGAATERTVTFARGASTAALAVELKNDELTEPDRDLTAAVRAGAGYTVGDPSTATVTVEDDDAPTPPVIEDIEVVSTPRLRWRNSREEDTYGEGENIRIGVRFDQPVHVEGYPVLALEVGDPCISVCEARYESGSGTDTLVFAYLVLDTEIDRNGVAIPANPVGESIDEFDGFSIRNDWDQEARLSYRREGTKSGHRVDGTRQAAQHLSVEDAEAREADGELAFTVRLEPRGLGIVTVDYATRDGSGDKAAVAGEDYTETRGTLRFNPLETERTVSVPIIDDAHDDDGETFTLRLSNPDGARLRDGDRAARGTIRNSDPKALSASFPASAFASASHSGADDRPQAVVAFSEAVAAFAADTPSVSLTGGRMASVQPHAEDGLENAWVFFLVPDGDGDVTFALVADAACAAGGICTPGGTALAEAPAAATIPGPGGPAEPEGPPLTASFEGAPAEHDGESAFTFRIAFSERVGWMNGRRLREHVVTVAGGRATAAGRVDRRRDLWQVTVEPDSTADVTVTLEAGAACRTPAAVCTSDGRALSNTISTTVAGPDVAPANTSAEGAPAIAGEARVGGTLTASTSGITDADGLENATFAYQWIRVGAEIPGATGSDYTAVDADEGERLQVRVGFADDAGNAESLTSAATQRVAARALPKVLAAAARAREGEDATLDFAVTLSAPAPGLVTVDYRTLDASAKAGEDYEARSGTLSFAPGETAKTVAVPVLDDAVDEGTEILVLRLENARGAVLEDRFAVGRIENSDPLQTMWLSRFGRTVAGQVVDAVTGRLSGPSGGSRVTLGGQRIDLSSLSADSADARRALAGALGAAEEDDPLAGPGPLEAARAGSWDDPETGATVRSLTGRELLLGSSFHLAAGGGETGGPGYAAWGRVAVGGFDAEAPAEKGTVRLDGEVTTGLFGADAEGERWLAGLALSVSSAEGSFDQPGVDSGSVESTLTSVNPYVRYRASDRLTAWGLLGYGAGDMTLTQAANDIRREIVTRTDLSMRLGAAGARGVLLEADESGGIDLALRGDAFLVQMESEKAANTVATKADASRVRLVLEAGRPFALGPGAVLTPGLELGLRHDGGDAETGTGIEVGGRIRYSDTSSGLTVEANARTLIAHEDSGYEEWGAGGSVRIDPGASGRGLSLSLAPVWGTPSSGVERLWSARDAAGLVRDDDFEATRRLEGEIGYGFGAFGERGVVTPYAGFGLAEAGDRTWRAGARWSFAPHLAMSLDGARREPANDDAPEHTAQFRLTLRW